MVDTDDTDDGIPEAQDAIPKDAILLTDAFARVTSLVSDHPELLPKFDEHWSEALQKSREEERKHQVDPDEDDKEFDELFHLVRKVNLFLRLEIEAKKLIACTRDPETGDILQLYSNDWIPHSWQDYIPPDALDNYIIPDGYDVLGPKGTFIRGALRPVFFLRDEFEAWFKNTFGSTTVTKTLSGPTQTFDIFERVKAHRRAAVKKAICELWGQNGPGDGVTEKIREREINKWLTRNGLDTVSGPTIRRALSEMRSERS